MLRLSQTELSHGHSDGYAERGVTVHDSDTDLDVRNLTVEIPRHEALAQQFHTVHLRFDAASAVVSGPVSSDGVTEVFRRAKGLVARDCACCRWFPGLGVPARWDDGMN